MVFYITASWNEKMLFSVRFFFSLKNHENFPTHCTINSLQIVHPIFSRIKIYTQKFSWFKIYCENAKISNSTDILKMNFRVSFRTY
jgi:hypothetical protein